MRKLLAPFFVVLLVAGCSTLDSPDKLNSAAKVLYASALDGVTAAYEAGDISPSEMVEKVEPARKAARAAIDEAEAAIKAEDEDAFAKAQRALNLAQQFKLIYDGVPK